MRKIINHHIELGTRESYSYVQDFRQPRLGKPRRGLQFLDYRVEFPRPSLKVVIDYINLHELDIKETTERDKLVSQLDSLLSY